MAVMSLVKCALLLAAFSLAAVPLAKAEEGWRWGRATFYGIWWSIHHGSCGYGNLDYWQGTGWDVAAIPDSHYEYNWSCGKCYEVKCEPMTFKDNYGNQLNRQDACYDPWKVVTVTIVDSCPCNYPSNAYSNRRWCCGDMDHFDLSYTTFDKLAARRWGVIGLKYRPVKCPSSYLQNRHHLGRRLQEDKQEGPEMVIVNERFERPDGFQGPLPLENGRDSFPATSDEQQKTLKDKDLKTFVKKHGAIGEETNKKLKALGGTDLKSVLKNFA